MKNKIIFLVSVITISLNNANAMDKEETSTDHFQKTPSVLIVEIGSYLYGKDFINFSITNKRINKYLTTNKNFFIPEKQEAMIEAIQNTSIKETSNLILMGRRSPKKSILLLRKILPIFEEYEDQPKGKLKDARKKFKNYIKVLNILHEIGEKEALPAFKKIRHKVDVSWEHTTEYTSLEDFIILNPDLYKFHYENLAFIEPRVRGSLSEKYKKGEVPFTQDDKKSIKFSQPINMSILLN
jgi:hypothetical protein